MSMPASTPRRWGYDPASAMRSRQRRRPLARWLFAAVLGLALSAVLGGCQQPRPGPAPDPDPGPSAPPLRVGLSGHYPPVVFTGADGWAGIEVELARRLAERLGRQLTLVETRWDQLIPALLDGRIDIIMSGMTITDARKVRIAFSEPYLRSGLFAMMRSEDQQRYRAVEDLMSARVSVGVVKDTTGDAFVQKQMPYATRWGLSKPEAAAFELRNRRIDLFVYDAPAVMWLVSENEAELSALTEFLDREPLGWGVRRDDPALLAQVNAALADWKADGSLETLLRRWLPYQRTFW